PAGGRADAGCARRNAARSVVPAGYLVAERRLGAHIGRAVRGVASPARPAMGPGIAAGGVCRSARERLVSESFGVLLCQPGLDFPIERRARRALSDRRGAVSWHRYAD